MDEFNKQREYLINKLRKFLEFENSNYELEFSDMEICALLSDYRYINYYFTDQDEFKSLLLQRKLLNRYARYHEIRFEDSSHIINKFINSIKPLNDEIEFISQQYTKQQPTNLFGADVRIPKVSDLLGNTKPNMTLLSKEPKGSKVQQEPIQIEEYIPVFTK